MDVEDQSEEIEAGSDGDWAYTIAEYVKLEEESEWLKHEYINGQIRAMAPGGTFAHSRLPMALVAQLAPQLEGRPCVVLSEALRIRIKPPNVITYPDLSVVCARENMDVDDPNAMTNPILLVEVTSKSSERYDRGKKWLYYQQLESLRQYVIVSQRIKAIDVWTRKADGTWGEPVRYGAGERAKLSSIQCEIDIDQLYTNPLERSRD